MLGKRQKVFTPASPYNAVDGGLADPKISGKLCNASLAPPVAEEAEDAKGEVQRLEPLDRDKKHRDTKPISEIEG